MTVTDYFIDRHNMFRKHISCRCDPFTDNKNINNSCECPYTQKENDMRSTKQNTRKYVTLAVLVAITTSLWFIGFTHWQ